MKRYIIYFELYGKKMKTTVSATSEEEAKKVIFNKINFHKVVEKEKFTKEAVDKINGLFNNVFKDFDKTVKDFDKIFNSKK